MFTSLLVTTPSLLEWFAFAKISATVESYSILKVVELNEVDSVRAVILCCMSMGTFIFSINTSGINVFLDGCFNVKYCVLGV